MASIRKRGDRWQVQVRRHGCKPLSKSFVLKSDALAWARQQEIQADKAGVEPDRSALKGLTVADLLKRYAAEITPTKRGVKQEAARIAKLMSYPLAGVGLSDLNTAHIATFIRERLATVGAGTVNRDLNVLSHALKVAARDWRIPVRNPVPEVPRPRNPPPRERRVDDVSALKRALEGCRNPLLPPFVELAIETGMRRSELLRIEWSHVAGRTLRIPVTKNGFPRTIPLSSRALEILSELRSEDRGPFMRLTENSVRLAWARIRKRAKAIGLRFHDLRHEAISRLFEKGLSVPEAAVVSGHRDFRMLARYTHLHPERIAEKLEKSPSDHIFNQRGTPA